MTASAAQHQPNRFGGFDYLRTIAILLVLVQHQFSVLDLEHLNSVFECRWGQIGVSLFLVVSGVLAAQENRRPLDGLGARMIRIYPAYWIATIVAFIGAGVSGYKQFDVLQVVSQLLGTGLYTHNGNLV